MRNQSNGSRSFEWIGQSVAGLMCIVFALTVIPITMQVAAPVLLEYGIWQNIATYVLFVLALIVLAALIGGIAQFIIAKTLPNTNEGSYVLSKELLMQKWPLWYYAICLLVVYPVIFRSRSLESHLSGIIIPESLHLSQIFIFLGVCKIAIVFLTFMRLMLKQRG